MSGMEVKGLKMSICNLQDWTSSRSVLSAKEDYDA